jgi:hypothetical protein
MTLLSAGGWAVQVGRLIEQRSEETSSTSHNYPEELEHGENKAIPE